ncbi:MAG: DUF2274 domain-containing protein [Pseudomonadota bacterium]|jgi:hypothetical protein|nr:DUF2274 domain-containing protein [Pseudomonadota bacterium]
MAKLRIGPLPDNRPIKHTITFTAALDTLIRDYAAAIAAQDGLSEAPPVEKLVPIIVERFITTDRAFRMPGPRTPAVTPNRWQSAGRAHSAPPGGSSAQIPPTSDDRPIGARDDPNTRVHDFETENRRSD